MKEIVEKILCLAVNAPSGNNAQPWRFGAHGNEIRIFNASDRDKTPYNFGQRGSYVAHGALIENIVIIAAEFGYRTFIAPFPDQDDPKHIATVILEAGSPPKDPLFTQILKRVTNRRVYKIEPLLPECRAEIFRTASAAAEAELRLFEDRAVIDRLARALGLHEKLIFENQSIHKTVFSKILWSKKEDERKRLGLYIKTKFPDMPEFLLPIMRLFGYWPVVKVLNKIGFPEKIYEQSVQSCRSVSAIGAIVVPADSPECFLAAGRLFERVWLAATKLGLSIQPVTGIPYLARRIAAGSADGFPEQQVLHILDANTAVDEIVSSDKKIVVMVFRLGRNDKSPVRTSKLPPEII
jgi:hypothetical protein